MVRACRETVNIENAKQRLGTTEVQLFLKSVTPRVLDNDFFFVLFCFIFYFFFPQATLTEYQAGYRSKTRVTV